MALARAPRHDRIDLATLMSLLKDPDVDEHELRPYWRRNPDASRAFAPAVEPDPATVDQGPLEGAILLSVFNQILRDRRQALYRRKVRHGFAGTRVVAEGDSWFQYPILLDDVVDQLFRDPDLAIFCLSGAGDTLADMISQGEIVPAIRSERPSVFMLSAGGNDMVGGGRLARMLQPFDPSLQPEAYPNSLFERFEAELEDGYRSLIGRLTAGFPDLTVLIHGYDYALPGKGGDWLATPMSEIGITEGALQRRIVRVLIDRFNRTLERIEADHPGRVIHVDGRGKVGSDRFWDDELHPTDQGYARVAVEFRAAIRRAIGRVESAAGARFTARSGGHQREAGAVAPPSPGFMVDPTPVDPAVEGRIAARRLRASTGVVVPPATSEREVGLLTDQLEKVHLKPDFLPARFLQDGAARSAAVCRIITSIGTAGTGFLISRNGFLMTNNHVLETPEIARGSRAEFDFQEGGRTITVRLQPDRLFITDERLDFTIVACAMTGIAGIEPVALLRDPATVAVGERVNIVQHPAGRPKEVALHDNRVEEMFEEVIRYRTDTEPGSSGSSVFNNNWELVALHHAGISQRGGKALNEGIRIASIVAHLLARSSGAGAVDNDVLQVLDAVEGASPFLGFFDVAGVEGDGLEVEVPGFTGDGRFADIGFWNIEHFNDRVGDARLERVADVLHTLSMDVMGLVEVEEPALQRLKEAMRARGDEVDFVLLDGAGEQDLAVLFDTDTTAVARADDVTLRHQSALERTTPDGKTAFPRLPLFARCTVDADEVDPVEFMMIVVHFKAFGGAVNQARRRLAADILGTVIEDVRTREGIPVVLGGDFNELLTNDVLDGVTDAPDLVALTADDAVAGAVSFIGSRRSLIDHIVVSRDVRTDQIAGDDAAIVRLDKSVADFADLVSDHVPIVFRMIEADGSSAGSDRCTDRPTVIRIPDGVRKIELSFA